MIEKPFNELTHWEKLWLKITDKSRHRHYLERLKVFRIGKDLRNFAQHNNLLNPEAIRGIAANTRVLNLVHSGNAGDIIYALPTIREIGRLTGLPVHLFLKLYESTLISSHYKHPLGNVMMNDVIAKMMVPLLDTQPYLQKCSLFNGEPIHIDLDAFRKAGLLLDRGNIAAWYNYFTGLKPDLSEKWLDVLPNPAYSDYIVLARSSRYNNPVINYSFLNKYDKLIFVGVDTEYEAIKKQVENIQWQQVTDFIELASIIAGCKLFIGNQSFPFAIAEGLKVPRLLETAVESPNVLPEGGDCFNFCFQEHLEWFTDHLLNGPGSRSDLKS
ncbi:glycosyltransferase family 9 protein [Hufsiella ginkgonis]|uniref:Uncharacterized protein n=1 Tax=Hufsiella ginkgonis TaxID=2695274 RepID=A0A7K1XSG5_9SPHI|nr:glycosyltransferase family 9 protein [Hufsiella ginkgonis]MXV13953.1 hypothetical protein [Hufsiella ginkgonis]